MTRFLRITLAAAAAQLVLTYVPLAGAASIQISLPPCDSFDLTGTAPNQSLVCKTSGTPVCTITPSNPSGAVNGTVPLIASCTGAGATPSYTWSVVSGSGSCSNGTASVGCSATSAQVGSVVYGVTANNGTFTSAQATTTVTFSNAPPPAPTGCSLVASPNSLPAGGGNVTLTATCSGGGTPNSFAWTGNGTSSPTNVGTQIVNVASSTSFSVTPSNSGTAGNTANASVSVATAQGAVINCGTQYSATKVIDATFPAAGATGNRYTVTTSGVFSNGASTGLFANDALVLRFTAPATDTSLSMIMYGTNTPTGMPVTRTMTLSTRACDFDVPASADALYAGDDSQTLALSLRTDGGQSFGYLSLQAGQTYYLNLKNASKGVNTCTNATGRCDIYFSLTNPR